MKKILYALMLMLGLGIMYSCEKIDNEKSASVYLSYYISSDNGESMYGTRGANADVFNEFYEEIVSGTLAAPSYSLTFTEVNTGVVYTLNGKWASHDKIILKTGTYHVTGKAMADGNNIQKECSLIFDDVVSIDNSTTSVCLAANYDCSLIIFNDASIAAISNDGGSGNPTNLYKFKNYYYAFINSTLYDTTQRENACMIGKFTDNAEFKIYTKNLNYEKGKFYVYTSIQSSFSLSMMEEGNYEPYEHVSLVLPPNNEIWYTSVDGKVAELRNYPDGFVSNTYKNGKGVMHFSKAVSDIGLCFKDNKSIKTLVLPLTITSLNDYQALGGGMHNVEELVLPLGLKSIGTDIICGLGENVEKPVKVYFTSEAPSYSWRPLWNLSSKDYNFYYPASSDYSGIINNLINEESRYSKLIEVSDGVWEVHGKDEDYVRIWSWIPVQYSFE